MTPAPVQAVHKIDHASVLENTVHFACGSKVIVSGVVAKLLQKDKGKSFSAPGTPDARGQCAECWKS